MNEIPDPKQFLQTAFHGIWLVQAPSAIGSRLLMDLAARFALEGPLRVVDSGNRFDAYRCSQELARYLTVPGARADRRGGSLASDENDLRVERSAPSPLAPRSLKQALERIRLARAFTCYQMLSLLSETPATLGQPTLVLDLLATFYDESVRADEALRLLESCLVDLRRLSVQAKVVVSVRPPRPGRGFTYGFTPESARPELLETLISAADEVVTWESPGEPGAQLKFL